MQPLKVDRGALRYHALIGVGGIGAGSFFAISGSDTLRREESRGGRFLDRRDYCKLHIIAHYTKALLGSDFAVIPTGAVGNDEVGRGLLSEMAEAGLDLRYVRTVPGSQTLFSFCFVYPDGSGGNLTTEDSACSLVDPAMVADTAAELERSAGGGVALAVPEVPLAARAAMLEMGTRYGSFRVASFTCNEMAEALESGMLGKVDLLAINLDEAAAALGAERVGPPEETAARAAEALSRANPAMRVSITAGALGSWAWDGAALTHIPACKAEISSTAGAGDAHLAGLICGLAAGLSMLESRYLAALVAGLSVESPHTINKLIDSRSLREFAKRAGLPLPPEVITLLED